MNSGILTIDDISSKNTPAIVDYLKENGIRAVMFAEGGRVERFWDEAVYALRNGMIVGNHSYSHPAFSSLSAEEGIREIEKNEAVLDRLYEAAGVERKYRPFRFPYGDKGGANKEILQRYLKEHDFFKLPDDRIPYPFWKESGLDRDIDTLWTYDFEEYRIRPGSGFTIDDVFAKMRDPAPRSGASLFGDDQFHFLLMHAHDETEELVPEYWKKMIGYLLDNGFVFAQPV